MASPLTFQQVILKLHEFWAAQDCLIWEPYNVQVGAGTGNPATILRVLGPEPWRVAYVEPSVRPDDGRFGENPNRMQKYYQYQVILKPDPGNPQELYLASLEALGIKQREHDIRFVEDNWESQALGAWGLGWEVWLDGQEITQLTYFQPAGGQNLAPVSVEFTYGIGRIVLALQEKESAWDIDWLDGLRYGDVMFNDEVAHCRYYFDVADVEALKTVYDTYEREYARALEGDALIAAYDYVLKCSHLFNVLDTRGAIGVTERANYFRRMREMTRAIAKVYVAEREALGHPLMKMSDRWRGAPLQEAGKMPVPPSEAADVLLEIGVEEMPADDVKEARQQTWSAMAKLFDELRLEHSLSLMTEMGLLVSATPRRIMVYIPNVSSHQQDEYYDAVGPPVDRAYDKYGKPTRAALGFAKARGVDVSKLGQTELRGGKYVVAYVMNKGRSTIEVLAEEIPKLIGKLKFQRSMRWNETGVTFSRPIRWIVALFGDTVIPFTYAGIASGKTSRGTRPNGSPKLEIPNASAYKSVMENQGVFGSRYKIREQIQALTEEHDIVVPEDDELFREVENLVETPTAFFGSFEEKYLDLPRDVLVTVMRKHQRFFAVEDANGGLLNKFIGVRNGGRRHLDKVILGNEHVLRARFEDASFFFREDMKKSLRNYMPVLETLTFQVDLGSMRAKNDRVASIIHDLGELLDFDESDIRIAYEAGHIAKADLATRMVIEFTSLQGIVGREYAMREGIDPVVATAIREHWLPAGAADEVPGTEAGRLLALADKLDSLVGLLSVGLTPKSTSDPVGLRRTALAILQIVVNAGMSIDLRPAIDRVAASQPVPVGLAQRQQVLEFLRVRLYNWFNDNEYVPNDVVKAVLKEQSHNPYLAVQGVEQLATWVRRKNWELILDSFARCVRITHEEQPRDFRHELLKLSEEKGLYAAYIIAFDQLTAAANVDAFLSAFESMVPAVTAFFDNVLVHSEDVALRNNRIALLQRIVAMQTGRADLSELENF